MPSDLDDRAGAPNVRLTLSNKPENVLLVRQMLTGVAEAVGLDAGDLNDLITAVTEACNNVVIHAYGGQEGPLEVEVYSHPAAIEVAVRDRGGGIRPDIPGEETATGIGLFVIKALSRADFRDLEDGGTEVYMTFAMPQLQALEPSGENELELPVGALEREPPTLLISITPAPLAQTILPRLLSASAARAHFTTDRLADTQLLADALAAEVPGSISGARLDIGISVEPREMELRIGPLRPGCAGQLIVDSAIDGVGPVIGRLTSDHRVATVESSDDEMLALRMIDRR